MIFAIKIATTTSFFLCLSLVVASFRMNIVVLMSFFSAAVVVVASVFCLMLRINMFLVWLAGEPDAEQRFQMHFI